MQSTRCNIEIGVILYPLHDVGDKTLSRNIFFFAKTGMSHELKPLYVPATCPLVCVGSCIDIKATRGEISRIPEPKCGQIHGFVFLLKIKF